MLLIKQIKDFAAVRESLANRVWYEKLFLSAEDLTTGEALAVKKYLLANNAELTDDIHFDPAFYPDSGRYWLSSEHLRVCLGYRFKGQNSPILDLMLEGLDLSSKKH